MKTIRNNVFETNSSTCHAVTICKKDTYQRYKKGELVCLVKVFIGQGVKAKISLCDDNFYDIDGFYNLIKKVRDFNKALPFSYRNYDFDAILNSSKKVIWRIFFNGELPHRFDIKKFSNYILPGSYILSYSIPNPQSILSASKDEIQNIKNSRGFIKISVSMEDH